MRPEVALCERNILESTNVVRGGLGTPRPKLLYLITRAERGGAQTHVLDLAKNMQEDFEVHIGTGEEGFLTESSRNKGIPVHVLPHLQREVNPLADARAFGETLGLMKKLRPDIIHAHTFKAGLVGRLAALRCRIPAIYTVHMWPFGPAVPKTWRVFAPPIERAAAKWCQRLITVSDSGIKMGQKYGIAAPSQLVAIHNGIPDCAERAVLNAATAPTAAMVARFTAFKDHELLIRAFAKVDLPARLLLIGDGPTRPACEQLARKLGIEYRVEFLGERGNIAQLLASVQVFVLASKFELFPISILEAMRAGLPSIASEVGGVSEAIVHGETGFLVPRGSVFAMAGALSRLLTDVRLRISFGKAARKRFESQFLADHMARKTKAIYVDLLAKRRQAA